MKHHPRFVRVNNAIRFVAHRRSGTPLPARILWQHGGVVDVGVQKRNDKGRPRSGTSPRPDLSAAEQILDAAAHLFAEGGFAATSTRAIADEVGIRQASLYYHFPSKEHMLEALLMRTVEPSARAGRYLAASALPAEVRLCALISFDTRQLLSAPHNVGSLYLLPEIRNDLFAPYRDERSTLRALYADLVAESVVGQVRAQLTPGSETLEYLVDVVFGMVESVITIRADRHHHDSELLVRTVAEGCLRVLGHTGDDVGRIAASADALGATVQSELEADRP